MAFLKQLYPEGLLPYISFMSKGYSFWSPFGLKQKIEFHLLGFDMG